MNIKYEVPADVTLTKNHIITTKRKQTALRVGFYAVGFVAGMVGMALAMNINSTDETPEEA